MYRWPKTGIFPVLTLSYDLPSEPSDLGCDSFLVKGRSRLKCIEGRMKKNHTQTRALPVGIPTRLSLAVTALLTFRFAED